MNEKQFDNLDDRFRQAAEQFDPPYDPADLVAMEKLLDGKKDKKRRFIFWWFPDIFMLAILLGIVFQINKESKTNPSSIVNSATSKSPQSGQADLNLEQDNQELNAENDHNKNGLTQSGDNSMILQQQEFTESGKQPGRQAIQIETENYPTGATKQLQKKSAGSNNTDNENTVSISSAPENSKKLPENLVGIQTGDRATGTGVGNLTDTIHNVKEDGEKSNSTALVISGVETDSVKTDSSQTAIPEVSGNKQSTKKEKTNTRSNSKKGRFFISGTIGLEKSGVGGSKLGPSGIIYGGLAGYNLNDKWSVKSGAFVTDKNYSGGSGVYKVPPGSYYQEITDFNAICKIIEIPMLISYKLRQGKKSNWLVSAGPVTSIMKSEEYHYHYLNNSGGTGYGKKYYSTNKVDWFSGLRISPAYERFFGNRFSASAEPFIQLPISGIGEGSVKLFSLGFQLTTTIHLGPATKN